MNKVFSEGREILFIILIGLFPGIVYLTAIYLQVSGAAYYGGFALIFGIVLYLHLKVDWYYLSSHLRKGFRIVLTDRLGWSRITPFSFKRSSRSKRIRRKLRK